MSKYSSKKQEYMKQYNKSHFKKIWRELHPKRYCDCCKIDITEQHFAQHTRSELHQQNLLKMPPVYTLIFKECMKQLVINRKEKYPQKKSFSHCEYCN